MAEKGNIELKVAMKGIASYNNNLANQKESYGVLLWKFVQHEYLYQMMKVGDISKDKRKVVHTWELH